MVSRHRRENPSPAIFPSAGDFWQRLLAKFSGLGVGAGRLELTNYETRSRPDGTGQVGVSRTGNLNQVVGKSILLQGLPLLDPPSCNPEVLAVVDRRPRQLVNMSSSLHLGPGAGDRRRMEPLVRGLVGAWP